MNRPAGVIVPFVYRAPIHSGPQGFGTVGVTQYVALA
jgi:hypothetical protein